MARTTAAVVFASLQLPDGMHHRWVPIGEAERLERQGECRRVRLPGKKSVGRTRPTYRLVPRPEPSQSSVSPCPITVEDMQANVGLARDYRTVRQARVKIRNYITVKQHDPQYAQ